MSVWMSTWNLVILGQTIFEIFEELISCQTNERTPKPIQIARNANVSPKHHYYLRHLVINSVKKKQWRWSGWGIAIRLSCVHFEHPKQNIDMAANNCFRINLCNDNERVISARCIRYSVLCDNDRWRLVTPTTDSAMNNNNPVYDDMKLPNFGLLWRTYYLPIAVA